MTYNLFIFKKDYILLNIMNYSYCKKDFKDEVNNRFENYLNTRDIKNVLENNIQSTEMPTKKEIIITVQKIFADCVMHKK